MERLVVGTIDEQDSALMRPGRLDRILYVGPPDHQGRIDILHICTGKMAIDPAIDLTEIADMVRALYLVSFNCALLMFGQTEGCSGAEISAVCQDAALVTMRRDINAQYVSYLPDSFGPYVVFKRKSGTSLRLCGGGSICSKADHSRYDRTIREMEEGEWIDKCINTGPCSDIRYKSQ